ncbi:tRNA (guanine-N7-)-methyltransferase [Clonorchis sinensis]|uniref:tRNA (guanine-N(7)-)-methyltransferase n=1 Tax=Clonorchis sinensis TaxID=79923 RepID=H2KQ73_CLOSI|nr:tRNA (guanine-N7-)-methyltransferase [Clonorchis sinensis]
MTAIIGAFDRTGEFRACARSYQQRVVSGRIHIKPRKATRRGLGAATTTFLEAAKHLSTDLQLTHTKLRKLFILLEEPHADISSISKLVDVIQCDIVDLNKSVVSLKALEIETHGELTFRSQSLKHNGLIVSGIECRLAYLVSRFQKTLENNKERIFNKSESAIPSATSSLSATLASSGNPDWQTNGCDSTNLYHPSLSGVSPIQPEPMTRITLDFPTSGSSPKYSATESVARPSFVSGTQSSGFASYPIHHLSSSGTFNSPAQTSAAPNDSTEQTQLLLPLADQEVRQRDANLKRVESTIIQLGEIYQQFSTLVQEQGDMVMRIDSNTEETELNIGSAHEHLLVYLRGVTARRAFMVKMTKRRGSDDNSNTIQSTDTSVQLPVKRYYRQRAHCNPWSDHTLDYPVRPDMFDWEHLFGPTTHADHTDSLVRYVDVGCGYGGLLFKLALQFPEIRSVGLEIRLKVCDFVQEKIRALRLKHPGQYQNIACLRTNAMKFLPNFFLKGQLQKMFFLYPDPHFKRMKHKWRIISPTLLDVYAYVLAPGGSLYCTTDVPELANWMTTCLSNHPLFTVRWCAQFSPSSDGKALSFSEHCELPVDPTCVVDSEAGFDGVVRIDPVLKFFQECPTDESLKATREGRTTTLIVCQRRENPAFP